MANGQMLLQLQKELEKDDTQPSYVRYLVAAQIETANKVVSTNEKIDCLTNELSALVKKVDELSVQTKHENEKAVTWPYLWDKFGVPIVMSVLTGIIAWLVATHPLAP